MVDTLVLALGPLELENDFTLKGFAEIKLGFVKRLTHHVYTYLRRALLAKTPFVQLNDPWYGRIRHQLCLDCFHIVTKEVGTVLPAMHDHGVEIGLREGQTFHADLVNITVRFRTFVTGVLLGAARGKKVGESRGGMR